MTKIYGIKNCDTIKKAVKWLKENNIEYHFHDYKKDGVNEEILMQFIEKFGWENVLNRRGTTWRKLSKEKQDNVTDANSALTIISQNPSMIKRPLLEHGENKLLGFKVGEYQKIFNTNQ